MDSIRQPFFASAVATTDRVLAAQVTSIFSTQILSNLKPSDIGAAANTRQMMFWKNIALDATSAPLYNVFASPVDEYGNPFISPANDYSVILDFGVRIKSLSGTETTPLQLRIFKSGIAINVSTVAVEANRLTNSLTVDVDANTTSSTIFNTGQQLTGGKSAIAPGTIPQLAVTVANAGNTTLVADAWASIAVIPS
jgi:hypothetical protein